MSKKKKKIPVPPDEKHEGYSCPPASMGDMTGLIPAASPSGVDAYEEMYPFLPNSAG